jgi:hypothetical protein
VKRTVREGGRERENAKWAQRKKARGRVKKEERKMSKEA